MRRFCPWPVVLAFTLPLLSQAATFSVTSTADSGAGSLRQALIDAGTDTTYPRVIQFNAPFPVGGVIELQTTLPTWSNDILKIEGNGRAPVLDGRNAVRILTVAAGTREITLRGLTFQRGRTTTGVGGCLWYSSPATGTDLLVYESRFEGCKAVANQGNAYGGAIAWFSAGSTTFIDNSIFEGNSIGVVGNSNRRDMFGGAVALNGQRVEISSTRFSDNVAERVGGVVQGLGGAAYVATTSLVLLKNVEFESNRVIDADADGALSAGGAAVVACLESECLLDITNVGFIDNNVSGETIGGGALVSQGGRLAMLNVSFSGNRANDGAGGALFALAPGELGARHLSFTGNQAAIGANLALSGVEVTEWAWSLFGPTAAGSGTSCALESIVLTGPTSANLFESTCGVLSASGGSVGPTGSLALDRSAFPATLAPAYGSPAIDPALGQELCTTYDARGMPRPQDGDGDGIALCDVGAYEAPVRIFANGFD